MLSSFNDILPLLDAREVCLPAFDIGGGQPDMAIGALKACEAARCPAALLVWAPGGAGYLGLEGCVDLVASLAKRAGVPVVLHLDHGKDPEVVSAALDAGFRSVMFDGSELPLDENIRLTREMVELAHARGATIEGELGQFGQEQGAGGDAGALTDPSEAGRFVRETGVDFLAPAVGNAHGFYKLPPKLRFDLIEAIAAEANVPLSLHGGTGIPLADVARAGRLGMRKMNIATQLHRDFSEAVTGFDKPSWRGALRAAREAIRSRAAECLAGLGAEGLIE